jgi:hypothetical protein
MKARVSDGVQSRSRLKTASWLRVFFHFVSYCRFQIFSFIEGFEKMNDRRIMKYHNKHKNWARILCISVKNIMMLLY